MADSLHHLHKRKRVHEKLEPYPHPDKWKNVLDKAVFAVAFLTVVMTVPQAAKIWMDRTAEGVSLLSWSTYAVGAAFWVLYGLMHREKVIVVIYALFFLLNLAVVAGILVYG
jgi:uncharacterized protein with PQ loop repeat